LAQVSGQTNLVTPIKSRGNTLRLARWAEFKGIDNIHRPEELPLEKQVKARNVYANDRGKYCRRAGQTLRLSGNIHSLFPFDTYLFGVRDGNLVYINKSYSSSILKTGMDKTSFTVIGTRVAFSDNIVIGYIKDLVAYDFSDVTEDFKTKVFPCTILRTYRGRMYLVKDNVLWITDAGNYGRIDTRKGFIMFPDDVTMIEPVDDGIYVSSDRTYFLNGAGPEKFVQDIVDDGKAVRGTSAIFNAVKMGENAVLDYSRSRGKVAVWMSDRGICMGFSGGKVLNPLEGSYRVPSCNEGAGFINTVDGLFYIVTLRR
jgi:hypothetical protein